MSRRKQVKPIRVSDVLPPQNTVLDFSNGGANYHGENGIDHDDEPMDMHVAIISCEKCPETFPSSEALSDHLETHHVEKRSKHEDFPTAYHRLGSELQQDHVFIPNGDSNHREETLPVTKERGTLSPSPQPPQQPPPPHLQEPVPPQSSSTPTTPSKPNDPQTPEAGLVTTSRTDSNRIFHQDAYCEICDREFCNKYFLKTHKANKHGVYENSPFSYGNNSSGFPNMPIPPSLAPSKEGAVTPSKVIPSPPATPKVEAIIQSMIKAETPKAPTPLTVMASAKASTETILSSSKSVPHPDMEDYCEICQKHFCNKYYLKKHKQDVHGIVPDTPSSSSKRNRANFDIPFTSATSSQMILPHNIASMASMAGLPAMPNMPGVMLLNPFMPPVAIIQAQSLLPHQQLHPHSLPVSQPLQLSPRLDSQFSTSKMSSQATLPSPNDSSKTPGVLNADAYCELCHKEFCNKMFLKIHKASKHGVFTDDGINIPPQFLHMTKDMSKDSTKLEADAHKSPSSSSSNQENYVTYCKPCNKEFSSKYSYKIHCMNVHGLLYEAPKDNSGEPDGSDVIAPKMDMLVSEGLLKVASEAQAANNNNHASTMFGNMIAAKLADRVICDICNKELCNKYFLKAHKLKVHGIDIGLSENPEKKTDSPLKLGLTTDMNDMPMFIPELFAQELLARAQTAKKIDLNITPPSDKPTYEELMKLGIDPEAYCEICKKEFCSKYFLRTHKLNIHGIKADKQDEKERAYPFAPMMPGLPMMPGFPFVPTSLSGMPLSGMPLSGLPLSGMPLSGMPLSGMPLSGMPLSGMPLSGMPLLAPRSTLQATSPILSSKEDYEKHTWRWKEPVNNSRVICDLCNKEVCNKYFLRTHKLNKHGITPSDKSLSPTVSGSPALSDCDTASNTSSQPDHNTGEKMYQSKPENLSLPKPQSKSNNFKIKDQEEATDLSNIDTEICHLCDRHFKNTKWLKAHIMKDHASWPRSEAVDMRVPLKQQHLEVQGSPKSCDLCGVTFPNEITMQLHLIQEHHAQVTLKTDDVQNGDSDSASAKSEEGLGQRSKTSADVQEDYSCVLCDYKTKWLSNLVSHEEKMHNILKGDTASYDCKHCPKSFPDKLMLSYHIEKYHTDVNLSISGSPTRQELKQFKCTMCSETFGSRIVCHKHYQEVHAKTSKRASSKLSCTSCPYRTRYPQLLKRHVERRHSKVNGNGNSVDGGSSESDGREMYEDDMSEGLEEEDEDRDSYRPVESSVREFDSNLVKPRFSPLTH